MTVFLWSYVAFVHGKYSSGYEEDRVSLCVRVHGYVCTEPALPVKEAVSRSARLWGLPSQLHVCVCASGGAMCSRARAHMYASQ